MSVALRILLLGGAVLMTAWMLRKIRKSQMKIEDALYWIFVAFLFVLLGLFPGIAVFAAGLIGVQSPANLVFLVVIFLLMLKMFSLTRKISVLEHKLQHFAQTYAIDESDQRRGGEESVK